MQVIQIAHVPAPSVPATATIREAIPAMGPEQGCAVAILEGKRLAGTLSKDDLLKRVLAAGLDPRTTTVAEVMTAPAISVSPSTDAQEALKFMLSNHQCYLPVVDEAGELRGWLALRQLFKDNIDDLEKQLDSIEAYFCADGPGGD